MADMELNIVGIPFDHQMEIEVKGTPSDALRRMADFLEGKNGSPHPAPSTKMWQGGFFVWVGIQEPGKKCLVDVVWKAAK